MNKSTSWNGYTVYGDSSELDKIIATPNIISLDKNDIISVLSREGEHRITTGVGADCPSALNAAISALGHPLDKVAAMFVNIYCNDKRQLMMSEIDSMLAPFKECLDTDCDVLWGIAEDAEIESPRKVTLLVTANVWSNREKMNDTDRKIQYFLCWIYDGYEIVEHYADEPEGRGGLCFRVDDEALSDGDGVPVSYNEYWAQIDEKDYFHVINLFRKTGEAMCECGDKVAKPLGRPIAEGDYLYDGEDFVHIDSVSADGQYRGEDFYCNYYHANICMETDDLDYVFDTDDSDAEFQLITEDAYRKALNILRSAIAEITDYLERLYKSKPHKN